MHPKSLEKNFWGAFHLNHNLFITLNFNSIFRTVLLPVPDIVVCEVDNRLPRGQFAPVRTPDSVHRLTAHPDNWQNLSWKVRLHTQSNDDAHGFLCPSTVYVSPFVQKRWVDWQSPDKISIRYDGIPTRQCADWLSTHSTKHVFHDAWR